MARVRKGDIVFIDDISKWAGSRAEFRATIADMIEIGARIRDRKSGDTVDALWVARIDEALTKLDTKRRLAHRKVKHPDRMPDWEARPKWKDPKYATNAEALEHMPGWTLRAAQIRFGKSGRRPGPRPQG